MLDTSHILTLRLNNLATDITEALTEISSITASDSFQQTLFSMQMTHTLSELNSIASQLTTDINSAETYLFSSSSESTEDSIMQCFEVLREFLNIIKNQIALVGEALDQDLIETEEYVDIFNGLIGISELLRFLDNLTARDIITILDVLPQIEGHDTLYDLISEYIDSYTSSVTLPDGDLSITIPPPGSGMPVTLLGSPSPISSNTSNFSSEDPIYGSITPDTQPHEIEIFSDQILPGEATNPYNPLPPTPDTGTGQNATIARFITLPNPGELTNPSPTDLAPLPNPNLIFTFANYGDIFSA